MTKALIPENVKQEMDSRIDQFNQKYHCQYVPRYKKDCLYFDRYDGDILSQICRLKYKGKINNWDFAIFKYSDEQYDEEEFLFPGAEHVNGTVEGAMRAGLKAYPF